MGNYTDVILDRKLKNPSACSRVRIRVRQSGGANFARYFVWPLILYVCVIPGRKRRWIQHRGHLPPFPRHTARDTSVATALTARHDTMAPKAPKELIPDPAKVRRRRRPSPIAGVLFFVPPRVAE